VAEKEKVAAEKSAAEARSRAEAKKVEEARVKDEAKKAADAKSKAEADAKEKDRLAALEAERQKLLAEVEKQKREAAEAKAKAEQAETGGASGFQVAQGLEGEGKGKEAVKAYITAARGGSCESAKRLGDIYDKGLIGVSRDYAESLKWYGFARALGTCEVPAPARR
jgi:TPR repeat protein